MSQSRYHIRMSTRTQEKWPPTGTRIDRRGKSLQKPNQNRVLTKTKQTNLKRNGERGRERERDRERPTHHRVAHTKSHQINRNLEKMKIVDQIGKGMKTKGRRALFSFIPSFSFCSIDATDWGRARIYISEYFDPQDIYRTDVNGIVVVVVVFSFYMYKPPHQM